METILKKNIEAKNLAAKKEQEKKKRQEEGAKQKEEMQRKAAYIAPLNNERDTLLAKRSRLKGISPESAGMKLMPEFCKMKDK